MQIGGGWAKNPKPINALTLCGRMRDLVSLPRTHTHIHTHLLTNICLVVFFLPYTCLDRCVPHLLSPHHPSFPCSTLKGKGQVLVPPGF